MNFAISPTLKRIPGSIWALGLVSLLMDASSELIHSLLPLFMVSALGASATSVGVVEGIAEATALIVKIFSGTLSDYFGKRKLLALIGYGMAACTKPLFPLAHSMSTVLAARFLDRIGKGIRGAPRDALVGDIAPPDIRGACFGLRQALDTVGAVIGPVLAMLFMFLLGGDMRSVLWIAIIPAFLSVAVLASGVREPAEHKSSDSAPRLRIRDIRQAGKDYWQLVAIAAVLTLARFSEAFLLLRALSVGVPVVLVPLAMVAMNVIYAFASYPAGALSDRLNRHSVLLIGIAFLIAADITLGIATGAWMLALGVGLWGLHMGFTQGLLSAMVADTAPPGLRGTAYGVYNLACGIAMLLANLIAGSLWDSFGPVATFFTGAVFTAVAMSGLLLIRNRH